MGGVGEHYRLDAASEFHIVTPATLWPLSDSNFEDEEKVRTTFLDLIGHDDGDDYVKATRRPVPFVYAYSL